MIGVVLRNYRRSIAPAIPCTLNFYCWFLSPSIVNRRLMNKMTFHSECLHVTMNSFLVFATKTLNFQYKFKSSLTCTALKIRND